MNEELLYAMALARLCSYYPSLSMGLYRQLGSAKEVFLQRRNLNELPSSPSAKVIQLLSNWDEALTRAEQEWEFANKHGIKVLIPSMEDYPIRLNECEDAPLVLYYKGNASLNALHTVSVVGTRHCTIYGHDVIRNLIGQLRYLCPDILVLSGLAYGVDIEAHRQSLQNGLKTVGVLAHGLDRLYPFAHRNTAKEMVNSGGLLTEFMTGTNADKMNFVRRNRIVAGMSDALILVESAEKGGGLISAEMANAYNREVMAVPGPVNAPYSKGCNELIKTNGARLITCADDLIALMGWEGAAEREKAQVAGIERSLFNNLSDDEAPVVGLMKEEGDMLAGTIAMKTNRAMGEVAAILFGLEMKGVIKLQAGGLYHLLS